MSDPEYNRMRAAHGRSEFVTALMFMSQKDCALQLKDLLYEAMEAVTHVTVEEALVSAAECYEESLVRDGVIAPGEDG